MATDINVILKKKIFDSSTDSEVGHIVYDNTTKRVYVGGVLFGSEIDNAEISSDGKLILTKIDGTTVEFSGGGGSGTQSDWDETDTTSMAYIKNKPYIGKDVPDDAVFTDISVTSADTHYAPVANALSTQKATDGSHIKGLNMDTKGHVTSIIEETIASEVANSEEPIVVPSSTSLTAQVRNITLSTEEPSGGNPGDIWIQYET